MILNFGKHKGKELSEVPLEYLRWITEPVLRSGETFPIHEDMKKEANRILLLADYAENRLAGMASDKTDFIVEGLGDQDFEPLVFKTLNDALVYLEEKFTEDDNGKKYVTIDPEDDRVLIWEILPSGHKKVVWHFSGWHWNADEFPELSQGCFIGHEKSVYSESMEDY